MPDPLRPDVSASLLVWARESSNLKIEDIAIACQVAVSEVEQWEAGIVCPTLEQLRHLASKTKRSLATFFLPHPPQESSVPRKFRTLGSKSVARLSSSTMVAIRAAQESQERALDLLQGIGALQRVSLPNVTERMDVQVAASAVRSLLGISLTQQYNWQSDSEAYRVWRAAIEGLGVLTLQSSFPLEEGRAFCLADDYAPLLCINSNDGLTGRIFSLLHELIHLCLGLSGLSPLLPPSIHG